MLSRASPRLPSVWWSVSASLCVSVLIFPLQQDLGGRQQSVPLQHPEGSHRSCTQLDNEQGDKVELWRSYHPEPPGHTALLVVTGTFIIGKTHNLT